MTLSLLAGFLLTVTLLAMLPSQTKRRLSNWALPTSGSTATLRPKVAITLVSAALLAVFGLILLLDRLPLVTARLQDALRAVGLARLVNIG